MQPGWASWQPLHAVLRARPTGADGSLQTDMGFGVQRGTRRSQGAELSPTLTTSYNTARMILDLDADDFCDERAQERFTAKELELFRATLKRLLCEEYVADRIAFFYPQLSAEAREHMIETLMDIFKNRLEIVTYRGKK